VKAIVLDLWKYRKLHVIGTKKRQNNKKMTLNVIDFHFYSLIGV